MKTGISRGAAALLIGAPFAICAQTPSPSNPTDDEISAEIVVSAQKRTTTLQEVPFSVAAVTSEDIKQSGATNIVDIARNIPGLYITDLGPGQSQVAIRGISAGQVVRDQPGVKESVGIYLDESPISVALFTPDLDLYDLDRIEVLRGPQGTLYGAGNDAGTVRYITTQPKVGEFGGSAEVGFEGVDDGDFAANVRGALNVPFGDNAAMRVVGYYDQMPGFIDSVYPGRAVREDVNDGDRTGGRIAFRFEPTENISITPRIVYQKLETDGYPRVDVYSILGNPYTTTQPAVDPGERGQVTQFREGIDDEFTLGDLKLEFSFGNIGLTSVTSYVDRNVVVLRDASQLTGSVTKDVGGTDAQARLDSPLYDTTDLQTFSQEIRLGSNGEGPFQWIAGVFYQQYDREYGQNLPTPGYDALLTSLGVSNPQRGAPPDTPFFSDLSYDFEQFAVFGEATYRFNPNWALTAGLRYYDFSEDRTLTFAGFFADVGYDNVAASTDSDGFSPRVILAYNVNKNVQFTAQYSRGFRLGGINDPLNVGLCSGNDLTTFSGHPNWEDEFVDNYELGTKTRLADGRVTFNAAVFMTKIKDMQYIADAGTCSSRIILNGDADAPGAEFELYVRPNVHWDFGLSATWVKAEVARSFLNAGQPVAGIREGNQLPTSPELQAVGSVAYNWSMGTTLESYLRFTLQYVGSSFTQLGDEEPNFGLISSSPTRPAGSARLIDLGAVDVTNITFNPELPSYELANLRWGVSTERWEGSLFINNLFDERAFLSVDRERGRSARVGYLTNVPRTYGVNFRVKF
jgi:iron complex outermembrane receptor protein